MTVDRKGSQCAVPLLSGLGLVAVLAICIQFFGDEIAKEVRAVDMALLWLIRKNISLELSGFFTLVTSTGAATFLMPATVLLTAVFLMLKHRRDALLIAASMVYAGISTFAIKALVNCSRPDLRGAAWYSSSSFPSGHTLCTTALATALVLCVTRLWPTSRYAALGLAALWAGLMALSRLVLGAHWPTDVLAAAILCVCVPVAINTLLYLHAPGRVSRYGVALQPLADRLRTLLKQRAVLHADETPVQQLAPGQGKTQRAYLWAYGSSALEVPDPPDPGGPAAASGPIVVFDYQTGRSGSHPRAFLHGWSGHLMADDYVGYVAAKDMLCRAALRRQSPGSSESLCAHKT